MKCFPGYVKTNTHCLILMLINKQMLIFNHSDYWGDAME